MKTEILDKTKKKRILKILEKNYGISNLPHLFIRSGEKIRIFSGSLSREELEMMAKTINVDLIGNKLGTLSEHDFRLNFDIMNLPIIKSQITKNIFELNDEQMKKYMQGNNLEITPMLGTKFISLKNGKDFIGIARNHKTYIQNYVPKERRIRK
ncbi:MAG: hypothetical protein QXI33_03275 [Candidatus Pacearchaeota archaeon]